MRRTVSIGGSNSRQCMQRPTSPSFLRDTTLTFHDLYSTTGTRMALAELTAPKIVAVTVHSLRDMRQCSSCTVWAAGRI